MGAGSFFATAHIASRRPSVALTGLLALEPVVVSAPVRGKGQVAGRIFGFGGVRGGGKGKEVVEGGWLCRFFLRLLWGVVVSSEEDAGAVH